MILFHRDPFGRGFDAGAEEMRDRSLPVLEYLTDQPVRVANDPALAGLGKHFSLELRQQPVGPRHIAAVEAEKHIGVVLVCNAVFEEALPIRVVFLPVAEFHIESSVHRPIVHLIDESFAAGHRAFPCGTAGLDGHLKIKFHGRKFSVFSLARLYFSAARPRPFCDQPA
jgi:hypothetical protein